MSRCTRYSFCTREWGHTGGCSGTGVAVHTHAAFKASDDYEIGYGLGSTDGWRRGVNDGAAIAAGIIALGEWGQRMAERQTAPPVCRWCGCEGFLSHYYGCSRPTGAT